MNTLLLAEEPWNKDGESSVPIEARVLAVAREWHELESDGVKSQVLTKCLAAQAGSRFDPVVVAAATQAVRAGLVPVKPQIRLSPK